VVVHQVTVEQQLQNLQHWQIKELQQQHKAVEKIQEIGIIPNGLIPLITASD